jgi:DHA2 family multidrug resistance protein
MAGAPTPPAQAGEFPPMRGGKLVLLTFAIAISSFMEILDMTIVNVSIPSIAGSLGVSPSEGTWAVSSYMLAAAVVQPLAGWIGRRFGEVRTFVWSIILFMVFSAICGLATTMPMLITARLLQGFVSGPMMSVAQALLIRNYPVHLRGLALGLWAMVVIIAPVAGPILGGSITDNLSWPWLVYINVPVDIVGLLLLVIGVGSLQFMLDNGNEMDWFDSPEIVASACLAVVSLAFFIPWELTDPHPVVDLQLFRRRNFVVGSLSVSVAYFAFSGINVVYPLWLQTTLGYTSTWAGFAIAPVGIVALFLAPVIGRNLHRLNLRLVPSIAFCIFATSLYWVSTLTADASFGQLALPRFVQGMGLSLFFLPLNQVIMAGVSANELASAAGLSNFLRTIFGSMSTAVCIFVWNHRTEYHVGTLIQHVSPDSAAALAYQAKLAGQGIEGQGALAAMGRVIYDQASTLGANDVFFLLFILYVAMIPFIWLARPPFGAAGTGGGGH